MYIMCVCLLSTLSRRVGALQISIIIIFQATKQELNSEKWDAGYWSAFDWAVLLWTTK